MIDLVPVPFMFGKFNNRFGNKINGSRLKKPAGVFRSHPQSFAGLDNQALGIIGVPKVMAAIGPHVSRAVNHGGQAPPDRFRHDVFRHPLGLGVAIFEQFCKFGNIVIFRGIDVVTDRENPQG